MTTAIQTANQAISSRARPLWSDRFTTRDAPIWSRLGKVFSAEDGMNAMEAMDHAGALAEYVTMPTFSEHPETRERVENGKVQIWRKPTMRDNEWRKISVVDSKFELVQPRDIAEMLDTHLTGRWPVDTVGVTPNLAGMFITLRSSDYDVNGDEMQSYFLITNGNDGGTALRVSVVHVRLKCWNTLTAALRSAFVNVVIPHRQNANRNLQMYSKIISQLEEAERSVKSTLQHMAQVRINNDQAKQIIEAAFPVPSKPQSVKAYDRIMASTVEISAEELRTFTTAQAAYDSKVERAELLRTSTFALYQAFGETSNNGGTVFAAYNAVAEALDNRAGKGTGDKATDNAAYEVLFGHRAIDRDRAFNLSHSLVMAN